MYLDLNSKVSDPKVYATKKEMELENKIQQLESKLVEKDREYFLIRSHNKKLCEQLEQNKAQLAEKDRLLELVKKGAILEEKDLQQTKALLDEAVEVITHADNIIIESCSENEWDDSSNHWNEKAREFLAKLKRSSGGL